MSPIHIIKFKYIYPYIHNYSWSRSIKYKLTTLAGKDWQEQQI